MDDIVYATIHQESRSLHSRSGSGNSELRKSRDSSFRNIQAFGAEPTKLTPPLRRLADRFFNIFLILTCTIFLIFAGVGLWLDRKPVGQHQWGKTFVKAESLGPTIFPILFALVVGNMTSTLARWRMEKGEELRLIEQLHASSSLASTFIIGYKLRLVGLPFVGLLFLWMLSPLGGQASLRLLYVSSFSVHSTRELSYLRDNTTSTLFGANSISFTGLNSESLFISSIIAPGNVRASSVDWAGNLKVPFLEYLEDYDSDGDHNGSWVDVGPSPTYSSLAGVQVLDLPSNNEINDFVIEGTYLALRCPIRENITDIAALRSKLKHEAARNITCPPTGATNVYLGSSENSGLAIVTPSIVWEDGVTRPGTNSTSSVKSGKKLDFYLWSSSYHATCYATQRFVEAKVNCKGVRCGVHAVRPSPVAHDLYKENYGNMDLCQVEASFMTQFIATAATPRHPFYLTLLEAYLINPHNPFYTLINTPRSAVYTLDRSEFEIRLAQLLNTMWRVTLEPLTYFGTTQTSDPQTRSGLQALNGSSTVVADSTTFEERYVCDKSWFAVLLVCSMVMLLAAVLGTLVGLMTLGPDIIGYVSSLTRDNPNCSLPLDSSAMDGVERTRRLGRSRVQLRDIGTGPGLGPPYGHLSVAWAVEGQVVDGRRAFDPTREYC